MKPEDTASTPEPYGRAETVDSDAASQGECHERNAQILRLLMYVEDATQTRPAPEVRTALFEWLAACHYSIRQIQMAANSIIVTETFGRPFAREFWFKACAQPLIDPGRIRELCRQAYEKGREDERKEMEPHRGQSGMDAATQRLLAAEKELMTLRQKQAMLETQISELERQNRTLQRHHADSGQATFYRVGNRLVVEHFRDNGEVIYHEQEIDETNIPLTRCRSLPTTEFDRQINAQNPTILTKTEIAELPGYCHWSTTE